jgi:hypothetical protein
MSRQKRSSNRLHDTAQRALDLPPVPAASPPATVAASSSSSSDRYAEEQEVFFGDLSLFEYIKSVGMLTPLAIKKVVHSLDFSAFGAPAHTGRPPAHPRVYIGLVVYGLLSARTSLRQLELLARGDLGCIYICGGIRPDHSSIGRFLLAHNDYLTKNFFLDVTRKIACDAGLQPGVTGIDGTVIQAAASAYDTLKADAAREAAEELRTRSAAAPEDDRLAARAELAVEAANAARLRGLGREDHGRDAGAVRVAPSEPDAVVQPLKQGGFAPSYKASAAVHESHLILGQELDPSSESSVVASLLDQCREVIGENPTVVPMDAGYSNEETFAAILEHDVNALIPAGREGSPDMGKQNNTAFFSKADFEYVHTAQTYRCPAGKLLPIVETYTDTSGRAVTRYMSKREQCAECPLRARCIKGKGGTRRVLRYEADTYKEEMAKILKHPQARREYSQRKTISEGRFGDLKVKQGLRRFRRKGLVGVRMEWALHCLAHNVGWAARRLVKRARGRTSAATSCCSDLMRRRSVLSHKRRSYDRAWRRSRYSYPGSRRRFAVVGAR